MTRLLVTKPGSQLTPREQAVMDLFDAGRTTRQIADELGLTTRRVSSCIGMYDDRGLDDRRFEAMVRAGDVLLRHALAASGGRFA